MKINSSNRFSQMGNHDTSVAQHNLEHHIKYKNIFDLEEKFMH